MARYYLSELRENSSPHQSHEIVLYSHYITFKLGLSTETGWVQILALTFPE